MRKKGARLVRSYAIFFSSRISFLCGATTLRKHSFSTTASRQHTSYFFLQFSYYPTTYLLQYREKWKRFQSLQTFQICKIIDIKTDPKWMLLVYDCYTTVSGHFFAICVFIFHKIQVQTVSLRCLTDLNPNLFKSFDTKCKYFHFRFFAIL